MKDKIDKFGYDESGVIRRTVSFDVWQKSRGGQTFAVALNKWLWNMQAGTACEAVKKAWEIYLVQIVDRLLVEGGCGSPGSIPMPFAKCEWDGFVFQKFLNELEGFDYEYLYPTDDRAREVMRDVLFDFAVEQRWYIVARPAKAVKAVKVSKGRTRK